jgi:serum/glucocorticoid-regulated kinase 2
MPHQLLIYLRLLQVLGKGSFGKVMMVRKKDDGKIFAMKTLRKAALIKRNQLLHTQTERAILQQISNPFLTKLEYAFQVQKNASLENCSFAYAVFVSFLFSF